MVRSSSQLEKFRSAISDCSLSDMGYCGLDYTWCNKRQDEANIRERLDRALCQPSGAVLFPRYKVKHLVSSTSDHNPLLIHTDAKKTWASRKKYRSFRFETMWLKDSSCEQILQRGWDSLTQAGNILDVSSQMATTSKTLSGWSPASFEDLPFQIREAHKKLASFKSETPTAEIMGEIRIVENLINYPGGNHVAPEISRFLA